MNDGAILLIEDDENDVFFFRRAAERAGIDRKVHVVRDGREAVSYLSGHVENSDSATTLLPEIVFLDLNLPHRNGLDILRVLRQQASTATVIVIVLTSSAAAQDIHEAYALGANSYLLKPTNPDQLVEHLQVIKAYWFSLNQSPPRKGFEPARAG